MSLLGTALRLALKAKMAKDIVTTVQEVLPPAVKGEIAQAAGTLTEKVQNVTAELLTTHAPEFSKKIARRAEPEASSQAQELSAVTAQLKELAEAVKAQNRETLPPARPAAKKKNPKPSA